MYFRSVAADKFGEAWLFLRQGRNRSTMSNKVRLQTRSRIKHRSISPKLRKFILFVFFDSTKTLKGAFPMTKIIKYYPLQLLVLIKSFLEIFSKRLENYNLCEIF
uniref:(northern house mosquito) hypothetical protein n=1 Tax=Culex pipiens TaxID=7175 RepID=A0A8D8J240_CULPI